MSTSDRIAIVSGSSRGIGKAIALGLARAGIDIAVHYRSDEDAASETVKEIKSLGRQAIMVQADLTVEGSAQAVITAVSERLGDIDILVNNVGEFFFKPLAATEDAEWRHVLDSNLSSVYRMCRTIIPRMRRRRRGQIVNLGLSPVYMIRGAPNISAYSIAKTGVTVLTRSLAVEEAPYGIRINCVSPGLIDNGYLPPEQKLWMEKRVPMGRLGTPEDIANAVTFLVSDQASYISGANLAVGGAWDWYDRPTDHDKDVRGIFLDET